MAVCLTAALAHYWGHLDSVGVALMYGGMVSLGVLLGCRSVLCSDERFPVVLKAHKGKKLLEQLFQASRRGTHDGLAPFITWNATPTDVHSVPCGVQHRLLVARGLR